MKKLTRKDSSNHRLFLLCFSILILFSPGCASTPQQDYAAEITRQGSTPHRIILNLTENPASSQALTWRTISAVPNPQAQIAPAIESPDLNDNARTVHATTEKLEIENNRYVHQHSVVFKSLAPDTLYAYRVGDGKNWSEWNQFRTASQNHEPFEFVYFGDPQNNIKSLCSRVFRAAYKKAPDADFWHFAGDLVNHGDKDEEWGQLYYALGWIPRVTPMIMLPGNHEYVKKKLIGPESRDITHLWRPQFTLPENGPAGLDEMVYFVDYQGVRFVMLDGNQKLQEQAEWLDDILAENPQTWTVAAIHQPFYSTAKNRDNPRLRELFIPIFDKYSVDLVLQGHDHTYGRTFKLRNGRKVSDKEKGTVYVVSVSGPKIYSMNPNFEDLMAKMGTGRQLFQVINVNNNRLKYQSFTATGERYDSFELEK